MVKRTVCFAIALLLMLCVYVLALGESETGMWMRGAFLDEFNMPTQDYYISNSRPIVGTFNDVVSSDQRLTVQLFMRLSDRTISIRLSEYGRSIVKNSSNMYAKTYDVTMLDPAGERHYMTAEIPIGGDAVIFNEDDSALIVDALAAGGPVRFAITNSFTPTDKYIFSIEDTMDFIDYMPYTEIRWLHGGMIGVKRGNKWGIVDAEGQVVVPCQWDWIYPTDQGYSTVFMGTVDSYLGLPDTGLYGLINTTGDLIIPCEWDGIAVSEKGLILVRRDSKYGFLNTAGETVIPCEWDHLSGFHNGLAKAAKDGKWGYIDTSGTLNIPCQWDYAYDFEDGIARIFNGTTTPYSRPDIGEYGYIDTEGNPITACEFENAYSFYDGLAAVQKNGKWGFIDRSGKTVLPYTWNKVGDFNEGFAWVFAGTLRSSGFPDVGKYGYVDSTGTLIIPCLWDNASRFSQGLAAVSQNGLYGYIDTSGEVVIPCQWDWAGNFNDGISLVRKDGLYGIIDTEGALISPCQWMYALPLEDGFSRVRLEGYLSGLCGILDASGTLIIPCEYDAIEYSEGYFALLKGGELIICDSEGNRTN